MPPELLKKDIESASYAELSSWIIDLGLVPKGNRQALQSILYTFYKIPSDSREAEIDGSESSNIEISTANRVERFAHQEQDEVITLQGGVTVFFFQEENGSIHTITANEIVLNQAQSILTAQGAVEYTLSGNERTDVFFGEKLQFDVDNWAGLFVAGETTQNPKDDSEKPQFTFQGDFIQRSSGDIIRLSQGVVTSSQWTPPAYSIRADEIIVYAPGEWSITGGALYVGNIPVFWLPAFFHPSEEIFFHPSFGFESDRGAFFYTTTYLLGRKTEKEDSFSFLSIADLDATDYQTRLEGLFLRSTEESISPRETNNRIMVLFDGSTLFGFHGGVYADVENLGILTRLRGYAGVGFTKNLYQAVQGLTSIYMDEENESTAVSWNKARLYDLVIPFRFGLNLSLTLNPKPFTVTVQFPFYSDPTYISDFGKRGQDIQWSKLLELSSGSDENTKNQIDIGLGLGSGKTSSFTWRLGANGRLNTGLLSPFIQSITLNSLTSEARWQIFSLEPSEVDPLAQEATKTSEKEIFLLQQLTPLSLALSIQGSFIPDGTDPARDTSRTTAPPESDYFFPRDESGEPETQSSQPEQEEGSTEVTYEAPGVNIKPQSNTSSAAQNKVTLGYNLSGSMQYLAPFGNKSPILIEEIFTSPKFWQVNQRGKFNLTGTFSGFGNRLKLTLGSEAQITQNEILKWIRTEEYSASDVTSISRPNSIRLSQDFTLAWQFFPETSPLRDWKVTYTINPIYFNRVFETVDENGTIVYTDQRIGWNADSISKHSVGLSLGYRTTGFVLVNTLSYNLPPLTETMDLSVQMDVLEMISLTGKTTVSFTEQYPLSPITVSASLGNQKTLGLTQQMTIDTELTRLTAMRATMNLFFLEASLFADYQQPLLYSVARGWYREGEKSFLLSRLTLQANETLAWGPVWNERMKGTVNFDIRWNQGLLRFTDSTLSSTINLTLSIREFLDLKFSVSSANKSMYKYFPGFIERVESELPNIEAKNIFVDLFNGVNIFNPTALAQSDFNLDKLSFGLVHDLGDWLLQADLSVSPQLTPDKTAYEWSSLFTLSIEWKAITEVNRSISIDDGTIILDQ